VLLKDSDSGNNNDDDHSDNDNSLHIGTPFYVLLMLLDNGSDHSNHCNDDNGNNDNSLHLCILLFISNFYVKRHLPSWHRAV